MFDPQLRSPNSKRKARNTVFKNQNSDIDSKSNPSSMTVSNLPDKESPRSEEAKQPDPQQPAEKPEEIENLQYSINQSLQNSNKSVNFSQQMNHPTNVSQTKSPQKIPTQTPAGPKSQDNLIFDSIDACGYHQMKDISCPEAQKKMISSQVISQSANINEAPLAAKTTLTEIKFVLENSDIDDRRRESMTKQIQQISDSIYGQIGDLKSEEDLDPVKEDPPLPAATDAVKVPANAQEEAEEKQQKPPECSRDEASKPEHSLAGPSKKPLEPEYSGNEASKPEHSVAGSPKQPLEQNLPGDPGARNDAIKKQNSPDNKDQEVKHSGSG